MKFEIFNPIVIYELGQRSNQEDSIYPQKVSASDSDRLFMVCDGMGGHEKGEVASINVIDAMSSWIKQRTPHNGIVTDAIIKDALQCAHRRLDSLDDGAENKMGTTLTLVCLHNGGVAMAHLGDSRIYHIRPSKHAILYKSIDHSLVYELYRAGAITYDEMATSPQRNVITRAIMPGKENNDNVDIAHTTDVQPGDYFYLCSDGMLEEMTDKQLLDLLCSDDSDEKKASDLVEMTKDNKDNHTALLIKIKNVIAEPEDAKQPNDEAHSPFNEMATKTAEPMPISSQPLTAEKDDEATFVPAEPMVKAQHSISQPRAKKSNSKSLIMIAVLLLALAAGVAALFLLNKGKDNKDDNGKSKNPPKTEVKTTTNDNQTIETKQPEGGSVSKGSQPTKDKNKISDNKNSKTPTASTKPEKEQEKTVGTNNKDKDNDKGKDNGNVHNQTDNKIGPAGLI